MLAATVAIEVKVVATVETAKALHFVLHGVRVHDVHYHGNAHLVRLVDELFQLVGSAETARCSIETRHMVAKRAVIRVFLYGHYLYCVIAIGGHTRKYVLAELLVCTHALGILRHAYVALVDEQRRHIGLELLNLETVRTSRSPHLCREYERLLVLHHAASVCRNALAFAAIPFHLQLVQVAMFQFVGGERYLPHTVVYAHERIVFALGPVVERAYHIYSRGMRSPFTEYPSATGLVQSEIIMGVGKVVERHFAAPGQFLFLTNHVFVPAVDGIGVWLKPRVILDYRKNLLFHAVIILEVTVLAATKIV